MPHSFIASEAVSIGHPDKLADQIADAIVDTALTQDRSCRVGIEVLINHEYAVIAGEISGAAVIDYEHIVQSCIHRTGYTQSLRILTSIKPQSVELASIAKQGANDQGIYYGYATTETKEVMPLPFVCATGLIEKLRMAHCAFLLPDAKATVTVQYDADATPCRIHSIVLSQHHTPDISQKQLQELLTPYIIDCCPMHLLDKDTIYTINPGGPFSIGGLLADTGLTGRKQIADTYGGAARHGGGALSGKDPTKIDRAGSYMARAIAKNICRQGLAARCEVELVYAPGRSTPLAISVDTFGAGNISEEAICASIKKEVDLTPMGIVTTLNLLRPIYLKTAYGGHFGRDDPDFTWENILLPIQ